MTPLAIGQLHRLDCNHICLSRCSTWRAWIRTPWSAGYLILRISLQQSQRRCTRFAFQHKCSPGAMAGRSNGFADSTCKQREVPLSNMATCDDRANAIEALIRYGFSHVQAAGAAVNAEHASQVRMWIDSGQGVAAVM